MDGSYSGAALDCREVGGEMKARVLPGQLRGNESVDGSTIHMRSAAVRGLGRTRED